MNERERFVNTNDLRLEKVESARRVGMASREGYDVVLFKVKHCVGAALILGCVQRCISNGIFSVQTFLLVDYSNNRNIEEIFLYCLTFYLYCMAIIAM